jgi:hypothetical protein
LAAINRPAGSYRLSASEIDQLVRAVLNFKRWIHRRVESKSFLDEVRMLHRTSLDFTIPQADLPALSTDRSIRLVPLLLLSKTKLRRFDLRDEQGRALPALSLQQNARIAAECLAALYELACGQAAPKLTPATRVIDLLTELVRANPPEAEEARNQLLLGGESVLADHAAAIRAHGPLSTLITDFTPGFLLMTLLAAKPGDRRVIKLSYVQTFKPVVHSQVFRRWFREFGRWIGWLEHSLELYPSGIGSAQSYHFELDMPTDLLIQTAVLRRSRPTPEVLDRERCVILTHLNAAEQDRGAAASVEIQFRLRASMLWPGFLISAATTVLLAFGTLLRGTGFHPQLDPASALLVALPALFAAFTIATEHRLTRRLAAGARAGAIGAALLSLIAAGTIAVTSPRFIPRLDLLSALGPVGPLGPIGPLLVGPFYLFPAVGRVGPLLLGPFYLFPALGPIGPLLSGPLYLFPALGPVGPFGPVGPVSIGQFTVPEDWRFFTWSLLTVFSMVNFLIAGVSLGRSLQSERRMV